MRKEFTKRDLFLGYGVEAYQARKHRKDRPEKKNARDGAHLILLAKNYQGYRNIMRLTDEANRTGFYYHPRVDWDLLRKYSEGVIATSACMGGLVCAGIQEGNPDYLYQFLDIFRSNFYIELHTYDSPEQEALNRELCSIADHRSIPVLLANDAHYPSADEYIQHEILMAIQFNKKYDPEKPYHSKCLYIMGEEEARERLSYLPKNLVDQAISNTDLVAEQCQVQLPDGRLHLPKFKAENSNALLIDLVEAGLEERYEGEAAYERAEFELDAIIEAGLADYFLIVYDMIGWCKKQGILTGPGRGSAGSSILSYALGITDIDPLEYDLYFERFWNPGRTKGLPDIDIDIEETRRDEVKEYLAKKYGADRVLSIGAYSTMGPKAAVRRVMKALYGEKTNYIDLNQISKILDTTTDAGLVADWEKIYELVGEELAPFEMKYPDAFQYAREFTDRITHYTTHASGVVISDTDLPEELPCRQDRAQELLVTQVDMRECEELGHCKFDLLGLRTLSTLKRAAELAEESDFRFNDIRYDELPESYWMQIEKGFTIGLFQIEDGDVARRIGKEIKPRDIMDLAMIIALNRPGPLRSGDTERYLKRQNNKEPVTYLHPILEPILKRTWGIIAFQEQVVAYFRAIGYDLSEADHIRSIMGKKKVEAMQAEYEPYMQRATDYLPWDAAQRIWDALANYSLYGFNIAHSVGYGTILAWTMYAKWRWPTEFIMASIVSASSTSDKQDRIAKVVAEGRRLGVTVLPPDINQSGIDIVKDGDKIYFGLQDIKGIGRAAAKWIIDHRPYTSYADFEETFASIQREWEVERKGRSPKQILRSNQIEALYRAGAFDALEDRVAIENLSLEEKAELEEELLGISLTDIVGPIVERNIDEMIQLAPLSELDEASTEVIPVAGVITTVRKSKVGLHAYKNPGEEFAWVSIDWQGETATFAAFPEEYKRYKYMLKPRVVGRFDLKVTKRGPVFQKGTRYI